MSLQHVADTEPSSARLAVRDRLLEGLPVADKRLEIGGVSTALLEGGEGPPLVMLHGQGGFAVAWLRVIPRLAASHHVIVPDLPGLGESVVGSGELDAERVHAWLGELIEKTCAEPPTLVGISLGGSIAARFAVGHGASCRRVVLVDSGSLGPFRPALGAVAALIRLSVRPSEANLGRLFKQVVVDFERVQAGLGERSSAFKAYGVERASTPSVQAANRRLLRLFGIRRIAESDLARIRVPVALIWGRDDRVMPLRNAESASARFGWPLYVIDNCGHFSILDQPDAFIDALHAAMAA